MSEPVGRVVKIGELAAMLGWSHARVRRHLKAVEQEGSETVVLRNMGRGTKRPHYAVSIRALQVLFPEWFGCGGDLAEMNVRIEELEAEVKDLRDVVRRLETRQDIVKKRIESVLPKAG